MTSTPFGNWSEVSVLTNKCPHCKKNIPLNEMYTSCEDWSEVRNVSTRRCDKDLHVRDLSTLGIIHIRYGSRYWINDMYNQIVIGCDGTYNPPIGWNSEFLE